MYNDLYITHITTLCVCELLIHVVHTHSSLLLSVQLVVTNSSENIINWELCCLFPLSFHYFVLIWFYYFSSQVVYLSHFLFVAFGFCIFGYKVLPQSKVINNLLCFLIESLFFLKSLNVSSTDFFSVKKFIFIFLNEISQCYLKIIHLLISSMTQTYFWDLCLFPLNVFFVSVNVALK